jgi:hypothetical protein
VDVTLLRAGEKSTQLFPGNAGEDKLLFRSNWQGNRAVERQEKAQRAKPLVK